MLKTKQTLYKTKINEKISYKDVNLLKIFLTQQGKILPRRVTGLNIQQQKKIAKAIKRARIISLLPFVNSNSRL